MLTPDTLDALSQALDAVIQEAGGDPQYADLVHALTAAQDALPDHADAASVNQPRDSANDPHSFTAAKAKLAARRSGQ